MMTHQIVKKVFSLGVALILLVSLSLLSTAKTGDRYRLDDDGNWIAVGGRNEFDEIKANSREEAERLESTLISNNYILVTTDKMSIDFDEYVKFRDSNNFWFSEDIVYEEPYWNNEKLYVYKPSFDDYMEQLDGSGLKRYTIEEINNSSVLIDYRYWESIDLIGTISDIFNDNIPSYSVAGYMQIESNINCEVKFLQAGTRRYYIFYVQKNTPCLLRLPIGCYHIVNVNNAEIPDNINNKGESTLPYNNQIQVREHHTIDNPYIIQLSDLSKKYKLKDMDISGKPDYSISNEREFFPIEDIAEETAVFDDDNSTAEKREPPDIVLLVLLICIAMVGIAWLIAHTIKSKREEEDNE